MREKFLRKFEAMENAGRISSLALKRALDLAKPGVTLLELDKVAEESILSQGAYPAFKKVDNYPFTTCINVNEGIVHGLPTRYVLKEGDILSIDIGAFIDGYNSDQCWTMEIGTNREERFLKAGCSALELSIKNATAGNRVGDISSAIEKRISQDGFSVSYDLTGHGIGRGVHENPYIPCFGDPESGPRLKEGMTLAIEVIYSKGNSDIVTEQDGWTVRTRDGSISAVFEHTVGVTTGEPIIFTRFEGSGIFYSK